MFSFTHPSIIESNFVAESIKPNEKYLYNIFRGLYHFMEPQSIVEYLKEIKGVKGEINEEKLTKIFHDSIKN